MEQARLGVTVNHLARAAQLGECGQPTRHTTEWAQLGQSGQDKFRRLCADGSSEKLAFRVSQGRRDREIDA